MYPPFLNDFTRYFEAFDKENFLVHVRRFRGAFDGKNYPEAYTDEEKKFMAKYMDDASIKYMLANVEMGGKLSYSGIRSPWAGELHKNKLMHRC